MPLILFIVTLAAMYIGSKSESKIKTIVEEREFRHRDIAMLVALIAIAVSVIMFIPTMAIVIVFLFSYSTLLFTVSYAYSAMKPKRIQLYCLAFIIPSIIASIVCFLEILPNLPIYGAFPFLIFAFCSSFVLIYSQKKINQKQKWYIAALSPVLFILLFVFFSGTHIWSPYLLDFYGITFAILIVTYLGSMFNWKTVFLFAGFLTGLDIILVWGTGTMVQAATALSGLQLPVLVTFPTIPWALTESGAILMMKLGLGDFFFAGILGTQTWKKFGKKMAIISTATIALSFGIFEIILLNPELYSALPVKALPATLPILIGWLPIIGIKLLIDKKRNKKLPT